MLGFAKDYIVTIGNISWKTREKISALLHGGFISENGDVSKLGGAEGAEMAASAGETVTQVSDQRLYMAVHSATAAEK